MTDTYKITRLEYRQSDDTIAARAFQSDAFNLDAPVTDESDARVVVEMTISSQGASIRDTAGHGECDFAYLATVLEAFATAFQSAHDDQNPGDSPEYTTLDTFTV